MSEMARRFEVGHALMPKKKASLIQLSLVNMLKEKGIALVKIDMEKPLVDQGPFDCVIHKMYGEEWRKKMEEFGVRSPNALIVDNPDDIKRLHNKILMLKVMEELDEEEEGKGVAASRRRKGKKVSDCINRIFNRNPNISKNTIKESISVNCDGGCQTVNGENERVFK